MQKGFLLYVRYNRNWTEVYGPFKSVSSGNLQKSANRRAVDWRYDKRCAIGEGEFASWCLAVPVADGEKLL